MQVNKIISQHLLLPKRFITTFGINPTVLLMELIDKELYHYKHDSIWTDGYFYHSKEYVFDNTALPRGKFDTARRKLEEGNLIFTKLWKGKKLYFKINNEVINQIFYPKNKEMWDMNLSIEPFLDESFIRYPISLAHTIGINETILIKDLLSKRNYFLKKWELRNGYFLNSVKNVCEDTTLTKKQQLKCVKNLEALELLHLRLDYDNTRYFCLNLEWIIKYENINLKKLLHKNESKKGPKVESKKGLMLSHPFINTESWKNTEMESDNNHYLKNKNASLRKSEKCSVETEKGQINNTKIIVPNNNIKQMKLLLCDLNFWKKYIEQIFESYELLNISISTYNFSSLLEKSENSYEFSSLQNMNNILKNNEKIIDRFYNLHIYNEKIISETLVNFSTEEIEQMFISIPIHKKQTPLSYVKTFLKKPFIRQIWEISVEKQIDTLIEVQINTWIENNEKNYEVMLQQEQIKILERDPLEKNPIGKAKNMIRHLIVSKKLKL